MPVTLEDKLVVAISSRALFNLEEENKIFEAGDNEGYMQLQLDRIDVPAAPGIAYSLIRKLLRFNDDGVQRVEVVILSRNDPVSGMRIFRSSAAADIKLQRGVFTQGRPPFGYLRPLRAHLFLSVNAQDVREALNAGFPAARVLVESVKASDAWPNEVRIAFDGDAVLFSDEAERVFQAEGLDAFQAHELSKADLPILTHCAEFLETIDVDATEALHAARRNLEEDRARQIRLTLRLRLRALPASASRARESRP